MEKNKSIKIIAIMALVVAVIGLSIGFAAFSQTLTIKSAADVAPDVESEFVDKIKPAPEGDGDDNKVNPSTDGSGVKAEPATLNGNKIEGIMVHFTKPGQSATYKFKMKNTSSYDAFLENIIFSNAENENNRIVCKASSDGQANPALVAAACSGIHVTVTAGDNPMDTARDDSNININNHILEKKTGEENITIKIEYSDGSAVADGKFDVKIGDIMLTYSTQDN